MGEFPSGQRGQTVNLLSLTSVVRIHLLPPVRTVHLNGSYFFVLLRGSMSKVGVNPKKRNSYITSDSVKLSLVFDN